jgi:hypothetical protein
VPLSLQQVSPTDSCRHGADQHLTVTGPGDRLGGEAEYLGSCPARGVLAAVCWCMIAKLAL